MAALNITKDPAALSFLLTEDLYAIKEASFTGESSATAQAEVAPLATAGRVKAAQAGINHPAVSRTDPAQAATQAAPPATSQTNLMESGPGETSQPKAATQAAPPATPATDPVQAVTQTVRPAASGSGPVEAAPETAQPKPAQPEAVPFEAAKSGTTLPQASPDVFHYLGENRRFVLVLVNYPEEKYLPEAEKAYLLKVLSAVKLGLEDIALLNYARYQDRKYAELKEFFAFNYLLLFGVTPNLLQIPGPVLPYHLGMVESVKILAADSTEIFRPDNSKKKQLWEELKKTFS